MPSLDNRQRRRLLEATDLHLYRVNRAIDAEQKKREDREANPVFRRRPKSTERSSSVEFARRHSW